MTQPKRYHHIAQIFLPGSLIRAYSITLSASTEDWDGSDISIERTFEGNGSATEVTDYLNAHHGEWAPYVGCEIGIDYGKGKMRRTLGERWGELTVEP
jgi:hypothetical protein